MKKIVFSFIALMHAVVSFAATQNRIHEFVGGSDGGGGKGVICYNEEQQILSVELLDLYEGKNIEGYQIDEQSGDIETILKNVTSKLTSQKIQQQVLKAKHFVKSLKFLPSGVRLRPVDDSGEIFDLKKGCKIEQIANFQGLSRIFVVRDFWDLMNNTNRAALVLHEYIWRLERDGGMKPKTSIRARRTVARYFATDFEFSDIVPMDLSEGDLICSTKLPSSGDMFNIASLFVLRERGDKVIFNFIKISGAPLHSGHRSDFSSSDDFTRDIKKLLMDPCAEGSDPTYGLRFDIRETVRLDRTHVLDLGIGCENNKKEIWLSSKNEEFPGYDSVEREEVSCHIFNERDIDAQWWNYLY